MVLFQIWFLIDCMTNKNIYLLIEAYDLTKTLSLHVTYIYIYTWDASLEDRYNVIFCF